MSLISVVGLQWGDEGKGKITDLLAQDADIIVRYQGGNNAGHSIKFDGKRYSLRITPSGIFNQKATVVIAGGVVLNPQILLEEIQMLKENGFSVDNLKISDRCNVIMPYHETMDILIEDRKPFDKVGTTKKGIGPCYSDKMTREGIRFCEFCDEETFAKKLKYNIEVKNKEFEIYGYETFDYDTVFKEYNAYAKELKQYMTDTSLLIDEALKVDKKVLAEGAQGVMLDIEHGTYPFVTSSSPSSASIPMYVGINPAYVTNNLGIVKAYTSRVGEGSFPTQIKGEIEDHIVIKGNEFGTVTKRRRNVGWLDLVQLKHSIRVAGISQIALMLLDVLDELAEINICIGYELDGKEIKSIPALESVYQRVKPIYKKFPGWQVATDKITSFDELPENAQQYVRFIEKELAVPVNIVSVGPDREQTFMLGEI